MLRVALPNKGQLSDPAREMLREAGYPAAHSARELVVQDPENDVEFFFLRPRDIAIYVASGQLDIGITGLDLVLDSGVQTETLLELGFAPSTFRFAAPAGTATTVHDLAGKRIATSYAGLLATRLAELGIDATVVKLDGAVENSVRLGVADAVADVVATGTTLKQAGLTVLGEPLLVSQALLVQRAGAAQSPVVDTFVRRLQGVIVARAYVLVDYDIRTELVERACRITPGIESPTVSSLHDSAWSAVRAMVPRRDVHRVMDELYDMGGRGILVTDIHACRL
ncbi:ATP phosphoribosyltransferase [Longivirga aurantiaca]|uniref:ATP phosphoribosyltransferase n=1 Tax=Longivirga aurantiaca TaxID=1837743 RepID=A0ABW1T3M6_9ACTN